MFHVEHSGAGLRQRRVPDYVFDQALRRCGMKWFDDLRWRDRNHALDDETEAAFQALSSDFVFQGRSARTTALFARSRWSPMVSPPISACMSRSRKPGASSMPMGRSASRSTGPISIFGSESSTASLWPSACVAWAGKVAKDTCRFRQAVHMHRTYSLRAHFREAARDPTHAAPIQNRERRLRPRPGRSISSK